MEDTYIFLKNMIDPLVVILLMIVCEAIIVLKARRRKIPFLILSVIVFFLYGISIPPVANEMCYWLEKDYLMGDRIEANKFDVVVVLGGGIVDNEFIVETLPSQRTASRLLYAVQVFRKSGANFLLCMGKGTGRISEADVMARAVERLGVLKDKVKVDPESQNTWEHTIAMDKMFGNKDIHIGLVTSAFHMKRSEREFRKYFHNVTPLPSDYLYSTSTAPLVFSFIPNSGSFHKTSMAFHEIIGLIWYRVKNT